MPNVIIEAMQSKTAIIGSNIPGIRYFIKIVTFHGFMMGLSAVRWLPSNNRQIRNVASSHFSNVGS